MKCSCDIAPQVRSGGAVEEDGKIYWKQIFSCSNPNCPRNKTDIGERKVNVLNESEVIEKSYI